jgi:hypothetical protein
MSLMQPENTLRRLSHATAYAGAARCVAVAAA